MQPWMPAMRVTGRRRSRRGSDVTVQVGSWPREVSTGRLVFADFYADEVQAVVGLAIALTGDRGAGEEVAQEAFTRAYRDWERIATYDDPGAWVRRVVANLSVSRWRRRRSERRAVTRLRSRAATAEAAFHPVDHAFWAAVRSLPRDQALAVGLFYIEDRSVADIAACMDRPENTVKSLLHRARARLAELLELEDRA